MNYIYDIFICLFNFLDSVGLVFIWCLEICYLISLFIKWFNVFILYRYINCNSLNRSYFNYIFINMLRSIYFINELMLNKFFGIVGYLV